MCLSVHFIHIISLADVYKFSRYLLVFAVFKSVHSADESLTNIFSEDVISPDSQQSALKVLLKHSVALCEV